MSSSQDIRIEGPAGLLEARLGEPATSPRFQCVVAHPHPLYGGTMDNATTAVLAHRLVAAGGVVLRFNFRGVGRSEGSHDQGHGEVNDLLAAETHLISVTRDLAPELPLWLAGYSFGAAMILLRAPQWTGHDDALRPQRLLALAPPLTHYDLSFLKRLEIPLALICGDQDPLTPRPIVESQSASWRGLLRCHWLEGLGHDLGATLNTGMGAGAALETSLDRAISELARSPEPR